MADRYFARSGSDRTDDWPFWFVADKLRGGLNVTAEMAPRVFPDWVKGCVLTRRSIAEKIAATINQGEPLSAASVPDAPAGAPRPSDEGR